MFLARSRPIASGSSRRYRLYHVDTFIIVRRDWTGWCWDGGCVMFVCVKCYVVLLDSDFLFLPVVVDMQYDYLIAGCCYSIPEMMLAW